MLVSSTRSVTKEGLNESIHRCFDELDDGEVSLIHELQVTLIG